MYLKEKVLCASIVIAFSSSLFPSLALAQGASKPTYGSVEIATPEQVEKMRKDSENAAKLLAPSVPTVQSVAVKSAQTQIPVVNADPKAFQLDAKPQVVKNYTGSENFYFLQEKFRKYLDSSILESESYSVVSLSDFEIVSNVNLGVEQVVLLSFPDKGNKKKKIYAAIMVKSNLIERGDSGTMSENVLKTKIRNLSSEGSKFIKFIDESLAFKLKTKKEISSISESMFAWKNFFKFLPELKVTGLPSGSAPDVDANPSYDYKNVVYINGGLLSEAEVYRQNLLRLKNAHRFKGDYSLRNLASLSASNLDDISKVKLPFGSYLKQVEIIEDGNEIYGILRFISKEGNNLAALFRVPALKQNIEYDSLNVKKQPLQKKAPVNLKNYLESKEFAKIGENVKYRVVPQNSLTIAGIKDVYDFGVIIKATKDEQSNLLVQGDKVYKEMRLPSVINSWSKVLENNPFFNKEYLDLVSKSAFEHASNFSVLKRKDNPDVANDLVIDQEVINEDDYRSFIVGKSKYIIIPASSVSIRGNAKESYLIFKVDEMKNTSTRSYLENIDDVNLNVRVVSESFLNKVVETQDSLIFTMMFNVLPTVNRGAGVVRNNDELDKNIKSMNGFDLNEWKEVDLIYAVEIQDRKFGKKGTEFGFSIGKNHFKYFEVGAGKNIEDMKKGRFYFDNVFYSEPVDEKNFKSKIS